MSETDSPPKSNSVSESDSVVDSNSASDSDVVSDTDSDMSSEMTHTSSEASDTDDSDVSVSNRESKLGKKMPTCLNPEELDVIVNDEGETIQKKLNRDSKTVYEIAPGNFSQLLINNQVFIIFFKIPLSPK